jgi:2-iminobutanoate/2-iminopropanoate deaminase
MTQRRQVELTGVEDSSIDFRTAIVSDQNADLRVTDRQPLHVPKAMCEAYHYRKPSAFSRGMEVNLGAARLIFVSGTASIGRNGQTLHPFDFQAQAWQAYRNTEVVLSNAGADWNDVVKATIFLKDISKYYDALNEVRRAYFKSVGLETYPASTCVEAKLCREQLLVEMELIAVVQNNALSNPQQNERRY